jgi:hypothetical protein
MMYGNARWLFWLASIVLLLLAVLVAAGVVTMSAPWLFPAGVLALVLALVPVWGAPGP